MVCSAISQPPPSVRPNGADTTGFGRIFEGHVDLLKAIHGLFSSSHSPSWAASNTIGSGSRPTQKFSPSLAITIASKLLAQSRRDPRTSCSMLSSPMAFILLWNSDAKHAVAQVDQRCAGVLPDHALRALHVGEHHDAGARLDSR